MKQPTRKEDKKTNRRKTLNSLCSVSALLLSVACCMALIHVELRIQEHHGLISHSVTVCDQMQTQILRKVQQNYERWQVTKADGLKGHLQGTNGKVACVAWRFWLLSNKGGRGQKNREEIGAGATEKPPARMGGFFESVRMPAYGSFRLVQNARPSIK